MSHAIQMRDVHYRASKTFEIRELSLSVPSGSIYGFLGPNGAGKTTTIRLMLGLLRPAAGKIMVLDQEMPASAPRVMLRTGFVPEPPHLYDSLTIDEMLLFHAAFHAGWDSKRADSLIAQFCGRFRGSRASSSL